LRKALLSPPSEFFWDWWTRFSLSFFFSFLLGVVREEEEEGEGDSGLKSEKKKLIADPDLARAEIFANTICLHFLQNSNEEKVF
jgi:hypothetical protein